MPFFNPPPSVPNPPKTLAEIPDSAGTVAFCETMQYIDAQVVGKADPDLWPTQAQVLTGDWPVGNTASDYNVIFPSGFTGAGTPYVGACTAFGGSCRRPVARHGKGLNVVYADGHAKWSRITQFLGMPQYANGWPYGDPKNSWDDK
jgi:prepilin-type processing-associated H-X9-DG protein